MENFEGIWDFETESIDVDIMDIKEKARINKLISELKMFREDSEKLTQIYTSILKDEKVISTLTKISQDKIFSEQFPEFFECNDFGENVINCQQNSRYHKYGVFLHTLHAIYNVGKTDIPLVDYEIKILKWTMLLHDIGKPFVKTVSDQGNDSFTGHEDVSAKMAETILNRFSFTDDEKFIIINLIKYHDKYINQGEITYDNMKFLASELKNNKKLFYLLLDVKEADAKAKCDEVYEVYKQVKQKYLEFIGSYFSYDNTMNISSGDVISETVDANIGALNNFNNQKEAEEFITNDEYEEILINTINRKNISVYYQPVIDLQDKRVTAYELFSKIKHTKKVNIVDLMNYAKKGSKFDKIQQVLMINAISDFEKVDSTESNKIFVNIDYESYNKYINKPRMYDMMDRNKIVLEFQNYSNIDETDLAFTIKTIHEHKGFVSFDNFGIGNISLDKLDILKPDFIKFDVSFLSNITVDSEKQRYLSTVVTSCMAKGVEVVAVGVEDRQTLVTLKSIGIRYVQGYFFGIPDNSIRPINAQISTEIDKINNETSL